MKDGAYQYMVEMTVPRGKRNGILDFLLQDGVAVGKLTMFTNTHPITQGLCSSRKISFSGQMRTSAGTIPYTASGTITLSRLSLIFHTALGDYPAVGKPAISAQRKESAI